MNASSPRKPCPNCTRKHLAQAVVLLQEAKQGYPNHLWLAVGHMAEAEAEIEGMFQDVACAIRAARKVAEAGGEVPDLMAIVEDITRRVSEGCGCDLASHVAAIEERVSERLARRIVRHANRNRGLRVPRA
jgi:hypothetical protein